MSGFANYAREGIILVSGQAITVDAALQVEGVTETVTVTGESPMISTRESSVHGVVEAEEIENVPINTRDVQSLALLVPGAKRANRFDPTKSRVPAISFGTNGSGRGILYMLDGGDNTDDAVGGIVQQVSMDSIQEFEVVTSRIKAEYARAGGGAITMVTKSGTNDFHGSIFNYFRDKSLNAETEPEKLAGQGKAPFRRYQFGGTLGGPIVRDKAFFFVTLERLQEDFNSILAVDPAAAALFDPALFAEHGGFGAIPQPFKRNYLTGKYTQQFTGSNRLDVRFAKENNSRDGDQVGDQFDAFLSQDQAATTTNDSLEPPRPHADARGPVRLQRVRVPGERLHQRDPERDPDRFPRSRNTDPRVSERHSRAEHQYTPEDLPEKVAVPRYVLVLAEHPRPEVRGRAPARRPLRVRPSLLLERILLVRQRRGSHRQGGFLHPVRHHSAGGDSLLGNRVLRPG